MNKIAKKGTDFCVLVYDGKTKELLAVKSTSTALEKANLNKEQDEIRLNLLETMRQMVSKDPRL